MASHGRSPDSAHSSDPWCYDYTYNGHGPTAKADIIMITNNKTLKIFVIKLILFGTGCLKASKNINRRFGEPTSH